MFAFEDFKGPLTDLTDDQKEQGSIVVNILESLIGRSVVNVLESSVNL